MNPGATTVIDLNADLGEGFGVWTMGDDDALLDVVTSANVACGFHAGSAEIMRRTCHAAAVRRVAVGAHVSYRDLEGFGRRHVEVPADRLADELLYQIGALDAIARAAGAPLRHVKAHGALYNRCAHDEAHAGALVAAVAAHGGGLVLLAAPGSVAVTAAEAAGVAVVTEGFVDRGYTARGALVPRGEPAAVLPTSEACVEQATSMALEHVVRAVDGTLVPLSVRSLCVHGDTPHAVRTARQVRAALLAAGVVVRSFAPA